MKTERQGNKIIIKAEPNPTRDALEQRTVARNAGKKDDRTTAARLDAIQEALDAVLEILLRR